MKPRRAEVATIDRPKVGAYTASPVIDVPPSRVIDATNADSSPLNTMIALAVFGLVSFVVYKVALWFGLDDAPAALIAVIVYIVMALFVVLSITGHLPVILALGNERRRITAQEKTMQRHYNLSDAIEANRHFERVLEITSTNTTEAMHRRIEEVASVIALLPQSPDAPRLSTIDANPERERLRIFAINWLSDCYEDGGYAPDLVHRSGTIKRAPWTGKPASEADILKRLLTCEDGPLVPVMRDGDIKAYTLRHDNAVAALACVRRV